MTTLLHPFCRRIRRSPGPWAAALALAGSLAAGAASAGPGASRGAELAREGRCAAALPELARGRRSGNPDAEEALLEAACAVRLGRYERALEALDAAEADRPDDPRIGLRRGVALFHLGDLAGAREALESAAPSSPGKADPEWLLYRGLVALALEAPERAAAWLARARERDPSWTEPVASYHLGLARIETGEDDAARADLERVVADRPGTPWAERAEEALAALDAATPGPWLQLRAGVEYDSNVLLRGEGVDLADDISDEGDWRGVWGISGGATLLDLGATRAGLTGSYDGSGHHDLDLFDVHYPAAGLWIDRQLGQRTVLRGLLDFGYAWVDEEPFLSTLRAQVSAHHEWSRAGASHVFMALVRDEYFRDSDDETDALPGGACPDPQVICGPPGLDEEEERDRDGMGVVLGVEHAPPLPSWAALEAVLRRPSLRVGYEFEHFDAQGSEYGFDAHRVYVRARAVLPLELAALLGASFTWRPFDDPSTFPDPGDVQAGVQYRLPGGRRREREVQVEAELSRALFAGTELALQWRYTRNHSTADVFDYDRHVVGLLLRVGLGG